MVPRAAAQQEEARESWGAINGMWEDEPAAALYAGAGHATPGALLGSAMAGGLLTQARAHAGALFGDEPAVALFAGASHATPAGALGAAAAGMGLSAEARAARAGAEDGDDFLIQSAGWGLWLLSSLLRQVYCARWWRLW